MPIPKPNDGESHDDFIERCMGNDTMQEDYPDEDQRLAICESQWEDTDGKAISILPQIFGRCWAISPSAMQEILADSDINARHFVRGSDIKAIQAATATRFNSIKGQIHVLPLQGVVTPRASIFSMMFGGTPLDYFGAAFDSAVSNDKVGAIVIDVDSPGGSVYGVHELAIKIFSARGSKPIIASINGLGASAAYWLASAADEVVVTPSGEAGSVGVIAVHEDISGFDEKAGVKYTMVTAGRYKAEGNEHEPLADEARQALQDRVDDYYGMMVEDIARFRGKTTDVVRSNFGEGRVYGAIQAKKAGMIDKVASLEQVLQRLNPKTRQAMAEMQAQVERIRRGETIAKVEAVAVDASDSEAQDLGGQSDPVGA